MKRIIIDVSHHQGVINWDKVKPNIDGAILRCGYGMTGVDKQFKRNADECTRLGIPFGVYLYSYAKMVDEAVTEAHHTLSLIKGYKLSYPVYYDLEQEGTESGAKDRAIAYAKVIEKAGYWCGMYANTYWWNNYLVGLDDYTKWVAQYRVSECGYKKPYDMWQYTSTNTMSGIVGSVDTSYCYRDLVKEITGNASTPKKSIDEIANEVINGKWGSGNDRKTKLEAAGYNYDEVQKLVNSKLNADKKVYHTVKSGENLTVIAKKYGTTVNAIMKLNSIKNANKIYVGQKIRVK